MQTFRRWLLFIIINLMVIFAMTVSLAQPSVVKVILKEAHRAERYSAVIIGQSHAETSVNPFIMSELSGSETLNCAKRVMPLESCFYILKDVNLSGRIKRVFLEIDPGYWDDGDGIMAGYDLNALYFLSWRLKGEYLIKELAEKSFTSALFDYSLTGETIKKIPRTLKSKLNMNYFAKSEQSVFYSNATIGTSKNYEYIGRGYKRGVGKDENTSLIKWRFEEAEVSENTLECFSEIAGYCRDNGIELICFISAVSPERLRAENHGDVHEYYAGICGRENVRFIDMNFVKPEYFKLDGAAFVDADGHMKSELADRQTEALCKLSSEEDNAGCFFESYKEVLAALE